MIIIIKEIFIVALLFGMIKIIMVLCKPVNEFISSITLNIGKGILYVATGIIILPKRIIDKSGENISGKSDDAPINEKVIKFFKSIAAKLVKFVGKIYMYNKVNYNICPNCFTKYSEPRYVCPKCGTVYHSLEPSVNGILNIECSCGYKIPVTAFEKRKLKTLCPTCGNENEFLEIPSFVVVVTGGEGCGKSTFLENSDLQRVEGGEEEFYKTIIKDEKGKEQLIMVIETRGKDFSSSESLKKHRYYEYNSGFIFMIDPFATANINALSKPSYMLSDVLDTIVLNLQKNCGLRPGETIEKPTAFVLAKSDMLTGIDLEKDIKEFLIENGEEMFINKICSNFTNYKFFKASLDNKDNTEIINWITRNM